MLIKLDNTYHTIRSDENGFWVDIPEKQAFRAERLAELILKLEWDFDDVSLPENLFTDDLFTLEEFLKLGFRHLEQSTICIAGHLATLRPLGYWSSKARKAPLGADLSHFRLYEARWNDENGKSWAQIFTEVELDALS